MSEDGLQSPAQSPVESLARLREIIRGYGSVIVAFSGGVDSAVVLAVATNEHGSAALGVIGNSPAYPASELAQAVALAQQLHAPLRVIDTAEHHDPRYLANTGERCFFCRSHLFDQLSQLARAEGFAAVADGVHADDAKDHVGGMRAARAHGVRSPLLEAQLGKAQVRAIARFMDLPVWDKPAMPCLASRVPTGTPIQLSMLDQIGRAEDALAAMGFTDLRVRHHGELARIEIHPLQMPRALQMQDQIERAVQSVGYHHVALDQRPGAGSMTILTS